MVDVSIVIPVYNEEANISILYSQLKKALKDYNYEIIFVDDGSTDNTFNTLNKINDSHLKIIKFRRNFGQTAALSAGFSNSSGKIIVQMDGDLQNDPFDIPKLIDNIDGYDMVSGWRFDRKDSFSKKILSKFANCFRRLLIHDPVHDSGCSLKAYKRECFNEIDLYGDMHRYIPALLGWKGFKIGEVKVNHFQRKFGETKYNYKRLFRGLLDLLNILFWRKYSSRPLHLFGALGILLSSLGLLLGFVLLVLRLLGLKNLGESQLPLLAVLLVVIGIQFFISGLMADISIKNYYSNGKKTYSIEKIIEKK